MENNTNKIVAKKVAPGRYRGDGILVAAARPLEPARRFVVDAYMEFGSPPDNDEVEVLLGSPYAPSLASLASGPAGRKSAKIDLGRDLVGPDVVIEN